MHGEPAASDGVFLADLEHVLRFLGLQFGFALQNANVSRIFQTLGAKIDDIPLLWIAAPLTGFLVQPLVGYLRPHLDRLDGVALFLVGALLSSAALLFMPMSPSCGWRR